MIMFLYLTDCCFLTKDILSTTSFLPLPASSDTQMLKCSCSLTVSIPKLVLGTSLVVQWVRLRAPNAGDPGSIPGWGTRSHMHAATKSSHATTKSLHATTKKSTCRN